MSELVEFYAFQIMALASLLLLIGACYSILLIWFETPPPPDSPEKLPRLIATPPQVPVYHARPRLKREPPGALSKPPAGEAAGVPDAQGTPPAETPRDSTAGRRADRPADPARQPRLKGGDPTSVGSDHTTTTTAGGGPDAQGGRQEQDAPRPSLPTYDRPVDPARPPILLSKFRADRMQIAARNRLRTGAPFDHRRARLPLAELPRHAHRPCEICKGSAIVWTPKREGGWLALCRRCGLTYANVSVGWRRPDSTPLGA